MANVIDEFEPGQRVRVLQQIPQRDEVWTSRVEGTVVRAEQAKTGSWFARNKDDKLWLDRLVLKKDDGEIVVCNLDGYSHVELLETEPAAEAEAGNGEEEEAAATDEADGEAHEEEGGDDGADDDGDDAAAKN